MKVFEVITEYEDSSNKTIAEYQYVTAENNTLKSVVDYFTEHCYQYEKELKSVKEVLVIIQHIKGNKL